MKKLFYFLGSFVMILLIGINAIFYYENMYVKNYIPVSSEVKPKNSESPKKPTKSVVAPQKPVVKKPQEYKATVNLFGDVFFNGYLLKSYYDKNTTTYKFDNILSSVYEMAYSDLNIIKFDSIASKNLPISTYGKFNAPIEAIDFLKSSNVDAFVLSSSHIFDGKLEGLQDTIRAIEERKMDYIGVKLDEGERTSKVFDINNIRIGVAAFSKEFSAVNLGSGASYKDYISVLNRDNIKNELEYLKSLNCDIIIAYANWGYENSISTNLEQKDFAKELIKNGADIVIGTHTHTIQPFEKIEVVDENGSKKEGVVFYSLGNFLCDQTVIFPYNRFGLFVKLEITKKENNINKKINAQPIYIFRKSRQSGSYYDFQVLKAMDILNRNDVRRSYIQYAEKLLKDVDEWTKNIQ